MGSQAFNDYAAGAIGGIAGLVIGHPFDTTKVRYQVDSRKGSLSSCMKNIRADGMVHGFFRGLSIPFASYALVNSVLFGVYGNTLRYLHGDGNDEKPRLVHIFLASMCGGVAQLLPACPVEVIKCTLQSQAGNFARQGERRTAEYFSGPWECMLHIIRQDGVKGLFKGLPTQAVRDIPASTVYLPTYNIMTDFLERKHLADKGGYISGFFSGGVAGVVSWMIIMPFDVVKSRLQTDISGKYSSTLDCVLKSYREGGIRIFFKGTLMCAFRAFPVNAATLIVYHKSLEFLNGVGELKEELYVDTLEKKEVR